MTYELKDYLKAINQTKEPLLDSEDEEWTKKYPPFIVNKCVAPFMDTVQLVNEINQLHHLDKVCSVVEGEEIRESKVC